MLKQAPRSWRLQHWHGSFDFIQYRKYVQMAENMLPDTWKIFLTTTEFLVTQSKGALCKQLNRLQAPAAARFRSYIIVGNDSLAFAPDRSLLEQRHMYSISHSAPSIFNYDPKSFSLERAISPYSRIIHSFDMVKYNEGLHELEGGDVSVQIENAFIMKFAFSPWPEFIARKTQIASKIPKAYFEQGFAVQHHQNTNVSHMEDTRRILTLFNDDLACSSSSQWRQKDHRLFQKCFPGSVCGKM